MWGSCPSSHSWLVLSARWHIYAQLSLFLSFSLSFSLLLSLSFFLSHFPISIWEEDVKMPTIDAITERGHTHLCISKVSCRWVRTMVCVAGVTWMSACHWEFPPFFTCTSDVQYQTSSDAGSFPDANPSYESEHFWPFPSQTFLNSGSHILHSRDRTFLIPGSGILHFRDRTFLVSPSRTFLIFGSRIHR